MKLIELCRAADIFCPTELYDVEINSVTSDSRKVKKGSLFVCLGGTKTDGNEYAEEAMKNGASAVLSDKRRDLSLFSSDAHLSLAHLCRKMYGTGIEKLRLVGVTGTNGKTSVTQMLASIFSFAGYKVGKIGTLGCSLGGAEICTSKMTTPDPEELYSVLSEMARGGGEYVFCELSSHALAKKKADALIFSRGIFTNITRDHLDFHKTKEDYFEAKKRIFELSETVIVNADDQALSELGRGLSCSARGNADFSAQGVTYYGECGCGYTFTSELCRFGIVCRLPGRFTLMNSLQAAACAVSLGVAPEYIKSGLYSIANIPGRMERVSLDGANFSVYIDYAHTPDALSSVLYTAKGICRGRLILVFGCGGERDRGKRAEMARIASRLADKVIITSDNSRGEPKSRIFDDILLGIDERSDHILIEDRSEAIEKAVLFAKEGDLILLAGKGHEKYEIDEYGYHPFDEAELVKKAFSKQKNEI